MLLPRNYALFAGTGACALALLGANSGPLLGPAPLDPTSPLRVEVRAKADLPAVTDDAEMVALRSQARVALAQLRDQSSR
jgi:hypothetical protein